MSWFTFWKRDKAKQTIRDLDDHKPIAGILILLDELQRTGFSKYTIRKAMGRRFNAYSSDVLQLMEWIESMYVTVNQREYVPDKWKQEKATLGTRILDDYLSSNGHDVRPDEFFERHCERLRKVCQFLTNEPEEQEMQIQRYYRRHYRPIVNDSYWLLKELYAVVTH